MKRDCSSCRNYDGCTNPEACHLPEANGTGLGIALLGGGTIVALSILAAWAWVYLTH